MAPINFLSGYFLTFVLDTPENREIIRRQLAGLLHRHLTSPPSLWPGCELQKYHYPCMPSWPCRLQSGILWQIWFARLRVEGYGVLPVWLWHTVMYLMNGYSVVNLLLKEFLFPYTNKFSGNRSKLRWPCRPTFVGLVGQLFRKERFFC